MASSASAFASSLLLILFDLSVSFDSSFCSFSSIVSFGDSLSDTGNYLIANAKPDSVGHSPYGETYFHHPTGRFSDGRIILDFIAEAMGLPYVPPYLGSRKFPHGVNFAVGGATAIKSGFFWERGVELSVNFSLDVQMDWFRGLLPSLCGHDDSSDCSNYFRETLFFVGEIGGNDYNIPFASGKKLKEVKNYVPKVIDAISLAIDDLVELGARTLVVPGYLPVGCLSIFLTIFPNSARDRHTGCIKWLNKFAEYHNQVLLKELDRSRQRHPWASIIYANYYDDTLNIFSNPKHFGFGDEYLSACCGGGGPYNYNTSVDCGSEKAKVCSDPSNFIVWDGAHLTEAGYRAIASQLLPRWLATATVSNACHIEI